MKTSELTGVALDWAVAKCEGVPVEDPGFVWAIGHFAHQYGAEWSLSGPIIERERIKLVYRDLGIESYWFAEAFEAYDHNRYISGKGPTPLIAAMRAFVASKLGDDVEIPGELQ